MTSIVLMLDHPCATVGWSRPSVVQFHDILLGWGKNTFSCASVRMTQALGDCVLDTGYQGRTIA